MTRISSKSAIEYGRWTVPPSTPPSSTFQKENFSEFRPTTVCNKSVPGLPSTGTLSLWDSKIGCTWGGADGASVPSPFCRNAVGGSPAATIGLAAAAAAATEPPLVLSVLFEIKCTWDGLLSAATCSVLQIILINLWHFLCISSLHWMHLNPWRPKPQIRSWQ